MDKASDEQNSPHQTPILYGASPIDEAGTGIAESQLQSSSTAAHRDTALHDEAKRLSGIVQTQQAVAQAGLNLQAVMDIVTAQVQELTHATGAVIEMAEGEEMVYRAASGSAATSVGVRLRLDASLSGMCVRTSQVLRCDDSQTDPRVDAAACRRVGARSMVVVPLWHDEQVVGVLKVLSTKTDAFDEEDVQTLQLMAGLIGSTLGRAAEFAAKQSLLEERTRILEERTQALESLQDSEARFHAFMDNSPVFAYMKDETGRFIYVNRPLAEQFQETVAQWAGKTSFDVWPAAVAQQVHEADLAALSSGQMVELEVTMPFRNDLHHWLTYKVPFHDAVGHRFMAGIALDITARKRAEAQLTQAKSRLEELNEVLRSQSVRDVLTGLFNRRYMEESLARELARAQRNHQPVGLILFDLDYFKRINDMYGHAAGDAVLRCVGQLVLEQTRKMDIPCRYGGEEFVLILPGTGLAQSQAKAETLRAMMEHQETGFGAVTLSLGVAMVPEHGSDGATLLQAADQALYHAKQTGRNCVMVASG